MKKTTKKPDVDYQSLYLRAIADYQNLEKRSAASQEKYIRFANQSLIESLLPLVDDLERAATHLNDQGLTLVYQKLFTLLHDQGLEEIKASNQPFNPELMECSEVVKGQKNQVVEVVTKGYILNDRVLRPAKVKVGQG